MYVRECVSVRGALHTPDRKWLPASNVCHTHAQCMNGGVHVPSQNAAYLKLAGKWRENTAV